MGTTTKTFLWLSVFAIAMGFLESAVVIYLRELYYPSGFEFPLQIIPKHIALVELFRETATLIMLIGAACLAGKNKYDRFAYFLIAFAVWDLFYYVFLYLFLHWPSSLFTWDILFLLPVPWTGPVIAPCLVAIGMLTFGICIIYSDHKTIKITKKQWFFLIGGSGVVISSFLYDYFAMLARKEASANFLPSQNGLLNELKGYVPSEFNWLIFFTGLALCLWSLALFLKQNCRKIKNQNI